MPVTTFTVQISANGDDYAFRNPGAWEFYTDGESGPGGAAYVGIGGGGFDHYWNGYRFTLPQAIPSNAKVTSAYLSIWSTSTPWQWDAEDYLRVYVTDAADPAAKTTAGERPTFDSGSTTLYPATVGAGVRWPGSGGLTPASDAFMQSVDISSLIQYLIDQYGGLASGAHVEVWLTEPEVNGANNVSQVETHFHDHTAAHAAKLEVTFDDAYPRIVTSNTTAGTSLAGGVALNMPSGIVAGDLLVAFASNDNTGGTNMGISGWTQLFHTQYSGNVVSHGAWAKLAVGGDTATLTGASEDYAAYVCRITGHGVVSIASDIKVGTAATGSDAAPNPPSLDAGSVKDWLWIASNGSDDDDNATVYAPTSYAPLAQVESAQSTTSCMLQVARKNSDAQTEDPPTFTMAAVEEWVAQTIAIPPDLNIIGAWIEDSEASENEPDDFVFSLNEVSVPPSTDPLSIISTEDSEPEVWEPDDWYVSPLAEDAQPEVPKTYLEDYEDIAGEADDVFVKALPSDDDAQFEYLEDSQIEDFEIETEWALKPPPSDDDAIFEWIDEFDYVAEDADEWVFNALPSDDDGIYTWLDEADEDNEAVSEWIFNALPSDDDAIFGWVDDELESVEAEDGLEWVFNALSVELAGDEAQFAYLEDAIAEELEADEWILNALPSDDDAHFEFIDEAESIEDVADEFAIWLSEVFVAPEDFQALAFVEDAEILLDEPDEWVSPLLSSDAVVVEDNSITIEFIDELEAEAEASDEFYVTPLADDEQPVVLASLEDASIEETDPDDFVGSVVVEAEALAQSFFEDAEALDELGASDEFVLSAISEAEQIVNAYLEDAPSDALEDETDFISNPLSVLIPEESPFAVWIDEDDPVIITMTVDGENFFVAPVRASQVLRRFRAKLSDARATTNVTLADATIKGVSLSDSLRRT